MTLENIQGMSQSELRAKASEKMKELHELIIQIDEETEFGAYATILFGVEEGDDVLAGSSQYGSALDIAQVLANEEQLSDLQTAMTLLSTGVYDEEDE
ncbi:DUF2482 family protein [Staphylococcus saprophyticus]|nr:DUF2482 family protein [Staphylococcus saprophyticus]